MDTPNKKEIILKLLEKIYNKPIMNIEFEEIEEFNAIAEYNFSIKKANLIFSDSEKDEIYLKMIKGGKIKESIFCFWSLLYEEYIRSTQDKKDNAVQKAIITQVTSDKNRSCILITLDEKFNYCTEINLIELKKFFKENIEYERWLDNLEIKEEDILFIGKKMY